MKHFTLILAAFGILLFTSTQVSAQSEVKEDVKEEVKEESHRNFAVVTTKDASYPGGNTALYTDLFHRMKYPKEALEQKISGDIMMSFYVEPDSTTSDVEAMKDLGGGTKAEAIRLIKETKFAPAIQNGKPVRQQMVLPVLFRIYD